MKKIVLLVAFITFSMAIFAQTVITRSEGSTTPKGDILTDPSISITLGSVTPTTVQATFTPNAECASYYILIGIATEMDQYVTMMGQPIEALIESWGLHFYADSTYTWNNMTPNTEYTIYALPKDGSGTNSTMQTLICTTAQLGGTGLSTQTLNVSEITATQARVLVTPNAETSVFHDGIIAADYYNEIGADSALTVIKTNPYPLYATDNWVWSDLTPNTNYYAIAVGQNSNNEWGTAIIVPFSTLSGAGVPTVANRSSMISVFPNPNNGVFEVEMNSFEAGEIEIYDLNGRMVYNQTISTANPQINAASLDNGCYFVCLISNSGARKTVQKIVISK